MVKRGHLNVPVIGVAKAGWNLDQLKARARDSLEKHGGLDAGGLREAVRPAALRRRRLQRPGHLPGHPQGARRRRSGPAHYLAIPPGAVRHRSWSSWPRPDCTKGARVIVEKPFGRDLASAQALNRDPARHLRRERTSSASTTTSASGRCTTCSSSASPTRSWSRSGTATHVESVQITMAENFGVQGRGAFYDETGTIRDVVQNHLFQVLANLAMEPPARTDSESIRDEKVKVLKAIPPLDAKQPRPRAVPRLPQRERAWRPTRRWRPSPRCGWRSIPGAGKACRSTSAPASACR